MPSRFLRAALFRSTHTMIMHYLKHLKIEPRNDFIHLYFRAVYLFVWLICCPINNNDGILLRP